MLDVTEIDSRLTRTLRLAKEANPRLRMKRREDSPIMSFFLRLLGRILLGKEMRNSYDERFCQTIGSTIYLPRNWEKVSSSSRYCTIRHELVHVEQFNTVPFGPRLWFVNHLIVAFLYMFILPVLLTFRARFERRAYEETFRTLFEIEGPRSLASIKALSERIATIFGSSMYLWMWNAEDAYDWAVRTQLKIQREAIS